MRESMRQFAGFRYSAETGLERDGKRIHLGPQARQLLELLLEAEGDVVSREAIAARLWPDRPASDDSIDRCAYLLRKPLRDAGGDDFIATAYGRGLSLRARVEILGPDAAPPAATEAGPSSRILELWQTAYELAGNRTREGFERAQAAIATAAELDPGSAPIWTLAADICAGRIIRGFLRPEQAAAMIEDAAGRALEIAPDFAAALAVLGWGRGALLRRAEEGLTLLDRSIAHDPHYGKARSYRSWVLAGLGRLSEAIADTEEGLSRSPLDQGLLSLRAWMVLCDGDIERALRLARQGLESRPDAGTLHLVLSIGASLRGRHRDALATAWRAVEASPGDPFVHSVLAYAQAAAGREREADATLAETAADASLYPPPTFLAAPVLALGRRSEALALLERASREGCPWFSFAEVDPRLESMRADILRLKHGAMPIRI